MSFRDRDEPAVRVFFALVPPPPLQRALAEVGRDVARRARGRPVPPDEIHLTLSFIGAWPVSRLSRLVEIGAGCIGDVTHVMLDTLGGFRRAGVAWIGISAPPTALIELAESLAAALADAGVATDERRFHPHLTLARRCHGACPQAAVGPYRWDVDALALMQSRSGPEGARYTVLQRWPLRTVAAGGEYQAP